MVNKQKILIVDDEAALQNMVREILAQAGNCRACIFVSCKRMF